MTSNLQSSVVVVVVLVVVEVVVAAYGMLNTALRGARKCSSSLVITYLTNAERCKQFGREESCDLF